MPAEWKLINQFGGFATNPDPAKVPDGWAVGGYNTTTNNGDKVSNRPFGIEPFPTPTASSGTDPIISKHTFRKRSGQNIMMRSSTTILQYYSEDADAWATLETGYTTGQKFGFADYNINTDLVSYVYFGNGIENYSRWNGAHTTYASSTINTITKEGTATWASLGFSATGSVIIGGTKYAYTGGATTTTLTGVSPDPTGAGIAVGTPVAQVVTTYSSGPKGNIFLNANNRIFVAGDPDNTQVAYFTKYGDATDFTGMTTLVTASTATSAGLFNLGEGGGGVTNMLLEEEAIYIFKKSITYKATLSDSFYTVVPLKPFDGRSQTNGALTGTVFAGENGVFICTPDNKVIYLERVEYIDYPQNTAISDQIKPSVKSYDFTSARGITFNDNAFLACKSSTSAPCNDVVLVWNLIRKNWDAPIIGWNVADWTVYNNGTTDDLYWSSANSTNTYKVIATPTDDVYNIASLWESKQHDFGWPAEQKVVEAAYVEGYIAANTTLTVQLLLDESGYTQSYTGTVNGTTDTANLYATTTPNTFGAKPLGTDVFGDDTDESGKKKFRVYFINKIVAKPFYNAQLIFSSDGANQQWDVTVYGLKIAKWSQPQDRNLYKQFT